jgi:hypothetical protein
VNLRPSKSAVILASVLLMLGGAITAYVHWVSGKEVAEWRQLLMVIVSLIVLTAAALSSEQIIGLLTHREADQTRWSPRIFWRDLVDIRKWPIIVGALGAGIGAVGIFLPYLTPPVAKESSVGRVQQTLDKRLPDPAAEAPVVKAINGLWGENDCQTVYRFTLNGPALQIERVKAPSGAPAYKRTGTVIGGPQGDVLNTRSDASGADQGVNTTFTFEPGGVEHLTWDDRDRSVPTRLDRCPESALDG